MTTYLCEYMNQKHYNLANELVGVRCGNEATVSERFVDRPRRSVQVYHWCKVHSYTVDRFTGAYDSVIDLTPAILSGIEPPAVNPFAIEN